LSEVEEKLQAIINPSKVNEFNVQTVKIGEKVSANENENVTLNPICPKCHTPFVLRSAKSGKHVGKQFYGCTNYPKCRETLEIELQ
jgi:ssDNA-binding Zn-finger/Zn-ribbon topoisomerase 1